MLWFKILFFYLFLTSLGFNMNFEKNSWSRLKKKSNLSILYAFNFSQAMVSGSRGRVSLELLLGPPSVDLPLLGSGCRLTWRSPGQAAWGVPHSPSAS